VRREKLNRKKVQIKTFTEMSKKSEEVTVKARKGKGYEGD